MIISVVARMQMAYGARPIGLQVCAARQLVARLLDTSRPAQGGANFSRPARIDSSGFCKTRVRRTVFSLESRSSKVRER